MVAQPNTRQLYEFDVTGPDRSRTLMGWWDGRRWVACFGDGMWSPDNVTAYRRLHAAPDAGNGVASGRRDRIGGWLRGRPR